MIASPDAGSAPGEPAAAGEGAALLDDPAAPAVGVALAEPTGTAGVLGAGGGVVVLVQEARAATAQIPATLRKRFFRAIPHATATRRVSVTGAAAWRTRTVPRPVPVPA
ncbi:hypothetical protein, partial [Actinotignum timonense]|uniref:hypothetical protein n=1 Tax=Actinotignum timonense TaxID=1870995 RepID=UPI002A80508B